MKRASHVYTIRTWLGSRPVVFGDGATAFANRSTARARLRLAQSREPSLSFHIYRHPVDMGTEFGQRVR